jgi:hypothetical protein
MIQLATDPNASRSNWRPAAADTEGNTSSNRRPRSGHAWPFIVRHSEQSTGAQDHKPSPSTESGA